MELEIKCDKNNRIWRVFQRLDRLRKDKDRCDVSIKVGSDEILAHKNVLSANSDYFDKMFAHDMKEKQSGICEMKEVDVFCVKKCVDYMYSCEIAAPFEKLGDLLHFATLLQLDEVCSGIVELLETNLSSESVFETRKVSKMFNLTNLEKICNRFLFDEFEEISKMDDFGFLDKKQVVKMMKSKKLKVSEDVKLSAVFNWIKFDSKSHKKFADDIIGLVDLSKLSLGYRRHVITNEDIVRKNADRLFKFSMSVMDFMNITPLSVAETASKEGIVVFDKKSGYFYCYNPENNSSMKMKGMNKPVRSKHSGFSAVSVDDFIYVLMKNKTVYRLKYNDENATWEQMADMLKDHGIYPPAVVSNDTIYVIGSSDVYSCKDFDAVEKYEAHSNIWTRLKNTAQLLNGPGLTVFQNKIYCFGGYSDGQFLNKVDQFDPEADVWKLVGYMPDANSYTAVVTVGRSIYILGGLVDGFESSKAVWCFDPISNHWQSLSPMLTSRCSFDAFAIQVFIYAVGGEASRDSLEKYNIAKDKWELIGLPEEINLSIRGSAKIRAKPWEYAPNCTSGYPA